MSKSNKGIGDDISCMVTQGVFMLMAAFLYAVYKAISEAFDFGKKELINYYDKNSNNKG